MIIQGGVRDGISTNFDCADRHAAACRRLKPLDAAPFPLPFVMNVPAAVGRSLLVLMIATGCGTPRDVTIRAAGIEPSIASTKKCAGPGGAYTVHYPASWFTVDHGPVPCRFFHPEPFALPESTEAPGLAIRVVLAPAPFDVIVPPVHGQGAFDETLSRRNGFVARHRTARIESRTRSAGILPAGTRQLTWFVETGEETLVATTSDTASSGRFGSNADVLDAIIAAVEFRPIASPGGEGELLGAGVCTEIQR